MYLPPITGLERIHILLTLKAIRPWWMILVGTAILYVVPAQTVLKVPGFGIAIESLATLVPSIGRWVELSPFPDNTKLFAVFVWLMIPVQVYWLLSSTEKRRDIRARYMTYLEKTSHQSTFVRLIVSLLALMFLGLLPLLAFNFAIVDSQPCSVCVNSSRFAQLFIGCMYSFAISEFVASLSISLPMLFTSLISNGNDHG